MADPAPSDDVDGAAGLLPLLSPPIESPAKPPLRPLNKGLLPPPMPPPLPPIASSGPLPFILDTACADPRKGDELFDGGLPFCGADESAGNSSAAMLTLP
jgi:hypothetical protein